jgi:hypothetical protein
MKKWTILFCLLALTACAGDDDDKGKDSAKDADRTAKPVKVNTDNLICPQVAILVPAQEIFDYGGERPDPSQLVAKARMQTIRGDCGYREDGIDIAFNLHITATRGKRLGSQVSFPYFIAIIDPAEQVLSRQLTTVSFSFKDGEKTAQTDEPLHVFIPLSKTAIMAGPDYRVLTGFKLPNDQLRKAE